MIGGDGEPHFRLKPHPDGVLNFSGSSSRGKSLCRPFSCCDGPEHTRSVPLTPPRSGYFLVVKKMHSETWASL